MIWAGNDVCKSSCYIQFGVTSYKKDMFTMKNSISDLDPIEYCWCDINNCNP